MRSRYYNRAPTFLFVPTTVAVSAAALTFILFYFTSFVHFLSTMSLSLA